MPIELNISAQDLAAPNLLWDTVWNGIVGDWAPASASEPSNQGGLRATAQLATAILLCLMSDARADPTDIIPDGSDDPRGWAGDAIDDSIDPLGSKWWLLRRRELTPEVANLAVIYAQQALQTLIKQGAVAKFDITAEPVLELGELRVRIKAYKQDGTIAVGLNFAILWNANGVRYPLSP